MQHHHYLPDDVQEQAERLEARRTEVLTLREEIDDIDALLARREQELSQEIADLVGEHTEAGDLPAEQN